MLTTKSNIQSWEKIQFEGKIETRLEVVDCDRSTLSSKAKNCYEQRGVGGRKKK